MVGIGFSEMLIIAGIALVLLGPEKFPEFAKMAIRAWRDIQKYMDEVKTEIAKEVKPLERELKEVARKAEEVYKDALEEMESADSNYTSYTNKGYASPQYLEHSVTTYPSDESSSAEKLGDTETYEKNIFEPYDPDVPQADLKSGSASYPHIDEDIYPEAEGGMEQESVNKGMKDSTDGKSEKGEIDGDVSEGNEIEYPERLDG